MPRNDPIPNCKVYVYGTNKVMTRSGRQFGYGKMVDLWCADNVFEAQDAVNNLSNNKNYSGVTYTESKPKFSKKVSVAVTTNKPTFVFGSENHQKFVKEKADYLLKKR